MLIFISKFPLESNKNHENLKFKPQKLPIDDFMRWPDSVQKKCNRFVFPSDSVSTEFVFSFCCLSFVACASFILSCYARMCKSLSSLFLSSLCALYTLDQWIRVCVCTLRLTFSRFSFMLRPYLTSGRLNVCVFFFNLCSFVSYATLYFIFMCVFPLCIVRFLILHAHFKSMRHTYVSTHCSACQCVFHSFSLRCVSSAPLAYVSARLLSYQILFRRFSRFVYIKSADFLKVIYLFAPVANCSLFSSVYVSNFVIFSTEFHFFIAFL